MRFAFYQRGVVPSSTMVVDGVEEGRLNFSHWPGNRTPRHLKADTSTEILLNLAGHPADDRLLEGVEIVSNNHFDTDGLLSCWAALHPQRAIEHRRFLIAAAEAGDFGWFTSPEAVRFDLAISAFEDPNRSPLRNRFAPLDPAGKFQLLYETLLEELPDLLHNFTSRYSALYDEEYAGLMEEASLITQGAAQIRNFFHSGLSIFEADRAFPLRLRFDCGHSDRLLTLIRQDGGWLCEFHYHIIT